MALRFASGDTVMSGRGLAAVRAELEQALGVLERLEGPMLADHEPELFTRLLERIWGAGEVAMDSWLAGTPVNPLP